MVLLFFIRQGYQKGFRRRVVDLCCRGGAHRHRGTVIDLEGKGTRKDTRREEITRLVFATSVLINCREVN